MAALAACGVAFAFAYFSRVESKKKTNGGGAGGGDRPKDCPSPRTAKGPVALNPIQKIPFTLIKKKNVSHDTRKFTFALQSKKHVLGLPVGESWQPFR